MTNVEKLDSGLLIALRAFEEERAAGRGIEEDGISVSLRFQGDLASIEAAGFETMAVYDGGLATGTIRFLDVPAIAGHPDVVFIAAGRRPRKDLERAAPDVLARASTKANVGTDGVWHVTKTGTDWHSLTDGTGAGVIVAIIDTGIDYTHPMFMSALSPDRKTRILRIWDQGLQPTKLDDCPDGALLQDPTKRYGVEYKQQAINDALKTTSPKPILHKDCDGHGTHVAGIAAGGRIFPGAGNASRVGIAPEADILVVKYLDVSDDDIRYRTATTFGAKVGWSNRFKDAVLYCLRIARTSNPKKAIVINMSLGDASMPGDGLDEDSAWLDGVLDPSKTEDATHVPAGAIAVKAMGNDGDLDDRLTAKITVPAGATEITVPLKLIDGRGGVEKDWRRCKKDVHKPSIDVHFWYRANAAIQFALSVPNQGTFSADVGVGGKVEKGFSEVAGTPPTVKPEDFKPGFHRFSLVHENPGPVQHSPTVTATRHHITLSVYPKETALGISYATGTYQVRIKAPAGTVIYALCSEESWGGLTVSFRWPKPDPANVEVTNLSSAVDTYGRNVITVASYQITAHRIADSSSRGPLRDFTDPPKGPIASKPDLAAPGVKIRSAESAHGEVPPVDPDEVDGVRFVPMSGTSMASPVVAGVVALLLDKKPALNITQVRSLLTDAALTRQGGDPPFGHPDYKPAFGDGMVHALESHKKA